MALRTACSEAVATTRVPPLRGVALLVEEGHYHLFIDSAGEVV